MHWTEWVMIVMLLIFAIPVLMLLWIIVTIIFGAVYKKFQKKAKPETIQTPFGDLIKHDQYWEGSITSDGIRLEIRMKDIYGEPNPSFLLTLPEILSGLASYELSARDNVEELNDEYHIICICDNDEQNEFCIEFESGNEDYSEVTIIYFKDGKFDNWSHMD